MTPTCKQRWIAVWRIRRGQTTVSKQARRFGISRSAVSQWLRRKRYQRRTFKP